MKAMILAAGLGTRLRPLTNRIPKALVEVNGKTMLQRTVEKLVRSGFGEIIINLHHHAEQIRQYVKQNNHFGVRIEFSDETALLLDTGGGLKKAAWFFNEGTPFLLHNIDILSDIDLRSLYQIHLNEKPLATLAVKKRKTERLLLFNEKFELTGWKNARTGTVKNPGEKPMQYEMGFCGIHVIDPMIFGLMKREGVFSIIDVYLGQLKDHIIKGYETGNAYWTDIGDIQNLNEADRYCRDNAL